MINVIKRIISGAVYIALIVGAILLLDNSPVMYLLVFPLLIVLGMGEMVTMAKNDGSQSWLVNIIDMLGGVGLFVSFYMHYEGTTVQPRASWLLPIAIYLLLRTIVPCSCTARSRMRSTAWSVRSFRWDTSRYPCRCSTAS